MNEFEKAVSAIDERTGWANDENVFESPDDKDIIDYSPNSRKLITATLTRKKWVNKVLEYAEKYPEEVQITHKNRDGSIVAHIPVSYLKITRPREMSEDQKNKARENMLKLKANKLV